MNIENLPANTPLFSLNDLKDMWTETADQLTAGIEEIRLECLVAANTIGQRLNGEYQAGEITTKEFIARLFLIAECMEIQCETDELVDLINHRPAHVVWKFS
jgi:hypothetical protein